MSSPGMSLGDILNSFVKLVQGKHNEVPSHCWIKRNEDISFIARQEYHGVVVSLYNRHAAVIVIAKKNNGIPLMSNEVWTGANVKLGRVLLLVNRLRPSESEPPYGKETSIYEVLREGDVVTLEIRQTKPSPDNIFLYFANTAFKITKKIDELTLADIRDPLRGTVESIINAQAGVIQFGTYDGRVDKAVFAWESLYHKGKQLDENLSLNSVTPKNTLVFLEVSKWEISELKTNWERELHEGGIVFKARIVWLEGDQRPLKRGGVERSQKSQSTRAKTAPTKEAKINNPENASLPFVWEKDSQRGNAEASDKASIERKNFIRRIAVGQGMRSHSRRNNGQQHSGGWRDGNGNHSSCADESDGSDSDVSSQSEFFSAEESTQRHRFKEKMKGKRRKGKYNNLKKCLNTGIKGILVSVDETWGLVKVDGDKMLKFQSNVAFLYGLKLEDLPLQKILFRDQAVRVYLEGEMVQVLEYGTPQQHYQRRAVLTYCEEHSIPREIRDFLECLLLQQDGNYSNAH